jgi:hypothetical protein
MAIAHGTAVPVPTGWKLIQHLNKGDYVFSKEGLPIEIQSVHEYMPTEMYRVHLSDGLSVDVDKNANFPILTSYNRQVESNRPKRVRIYKVKQRYATVPQMLERGLVEWRQNFFSLNTVKPIHFLSEDHPVPPFIVGMWMTNRNTTDKYYIRPEFMDYVQKKIKSVGWSFIMKNHRLIEIRPSIKHAFLTKYAKMPTILPVAYFFGSVEQRIELLKGLVATKPMCYKENTDQFHIYSKDVKFLTGIQSICESLGIKTFVYHKEKCFTSELRFKTNINLHPKQPADSGTKNCIRRHIDKIELINSVPCIHIETKQPFVVGQGFLSVWH